MSIQTIVTCPRCGKEWIATQEEDEVDCNCHTYCEDGSKPSDCSLSAYVLNHEVGAPYGAHVGSGNGDEDPMHIQYYCSVHNRYGYKTPISIPIDWENVLSRRAPKKVRWMNRT